MSAMRTIFHIREAYATLMLDEAAVETTRRIQS
jgi:hypothetical protein